MKKSKYLNGYKIQLTFDDGSVKIVDLEEFLKNSKHMLAPLKDIEYFKTVKCDGTTICWPNGVDLCPNVLYEMGKDVARPAQKRKRSSKVPTIRKKTRAKTGKLHEKF